MRHAFLALMMLLAPAAGSVATAPWAAAQDAEPSLQVYGAWMASIQDHTVQIHELVAHGEAGAQILERSWEEGLDSDAAQSPFNAWGVEMNTALDAYHAEAEAIMAARPAVPDAISPIADHFAEIPWRNVERAEVYFAQVVEALQALADCQSSGYQALDRARLDVSLSLYQAEQTNAVITASTMPPDHPEAAFMRAVAENNGAIALVYEAARRSIGARPSLDTPADIEAALNAHAQSVANQMQTLIRQTDLEIASWSNLTPGEADVTLAQRDLALRGLAAAKAGFQIEQDLAARLSADAHRSTLFYDHQGWEALLLDVSAFEIDRQRRLAERQHLKAQAELYR